MKKLMIATSAVVGLGLVSADFAAAQMETSLSGLVRVRMGDTGLDDSNPTLAVNRAQLTWKATGTSDSGLTYGAQLRLRNGETHDDNIFFGGAFGTFTIGETGGHGDLSNGAEAAGAGSGGVDGGVSTASGQAGVVTHDIDAYLANNSKIAYASPSFGGVTVGASYSLDSDGANASDASYDVSLAYGGTFGDTSIGMHLVHSNVTTATDAVAAAAAVAAQTITLDETVDLVDYNNDGDTADAAVIVVTDAPVAAVVAVPASETNTKSTGVGVNAGFGPVTAGFSYNDNDDGKTTMAASVKYGFGNGAVSLGYMFSDDDSTTGTKNKASSVIVSADYTVAPGWSVAVDVANNDGEVGANESSSTSWLLQSVVSF